MKIPQRLYVIIPIVITIVSSVGCDLKPRSSTFASLDLDSSYHVKYARCFSWAGGENKNVIISILQPNPDKSVVLQEIDWRFNPVQRVGCLSTTHIPFLKALASDEMIVATGFSEIKSEPEIDEAMREKRILNVAEAGTLDKELLIQLAPELFFIYPFGGNTCQDMLDAGIGCVQVTEYLEEHPLGRAEWIKLFGALLNRYAMADSIFNGIERRYMETIAVSQQNTPLVFFGTFDGEAFYAPPGNSFIAQLIRDAGAKYYFEDSKGSSNIRLDKEQMIEIAAKANYMGTVEFGRNEWSQNILALSKENNPILFRCDAASRDYYGKAILEPDVLLRDFINIFHRNGISGDSLKYFEFCRPR